jgi:hypothetical protein
LEHLDAPPELPLAGQEILLRALMFQNDLGECPE